jgi:hypothetical protein
MDKYEGWDNHKGNQFVSVDVFYLNEEITLIWKE